MCVCRELLSAAAGHPGLPLRGSAARVRSVLSRDARLMELVVVCHAMWIVV